MSSSLIILFVTVLTTDTFAVPVCLACMSTFMGITWPAVNFWTLAVLSSNCCPLHKDKSQREASKSFCDDPN